MTPVAIALISLKPIFTSNLAGGAPSPGTPVAARVTIVVPGARRAAAGVGRARWTTRRSSAPWRCAGRARACARSRPSLTCRERWSGARWQREQAGRTAVCAFAQRRRPTHPMVHVTWRLRARSRAVLPQVRVFRERNNDAVRADTPSERERLDLVDRLGGLSTFSR